MATDIKVKVLRSGVQIYPKVAMRIDNMSDVEASYYGGSAPYMRNRCYTLAIYDIHQEDQCIDLVNTDSKTKSGYREYRVINIPEVFLNGSLEIVADRVRGK